MAKVQSFADKAAKLAKKDAEVMCPSCNKSAKRIYAKMITSVKTEKETWKYLEKNVRLCNNCLSEI
ncbi:MAG: hypothetical protein EHM58_10655 [Ignavibacteriae bacterium]|nr:MAG: hypothetical protein EHM58_10655 [Ignavibacteriota bacterium]